VAISGFVIIMTIQLLLDRFASKVSGVNLKTEVKRGDIISNVSFSDVKGVDEAVNDLHEIVEYLKNPSRFTRLGGKLPKGLLLTGPPGTGKTLMARAIAGEAKVPFYYATGSEFDEMLVGVGARRVRELFAEAKEHSPCIIFIDEIDAIGSTRKLDLTNGTKVTLNQLLTEMDGFEGSTGIIVIGATNFPEILDKALTRPGRFDRLVHVPLPDVQGRREILKLYLRKVPHENDVDVDNIARQTTGLSGAELANIVNIAAIQAVIDHSDLVKMSHIQQAIARVFLGAERKSATVSDNAHRLTAYHEGGHALAHLFTPAARPLQQATIIPRGPSLGATWSLNPSEEHFKTREQYLADLDVAMGGRAAEALIFGERVVTSGAASDLQQATAVATAMVTQLGFSDKVGLLSLDEKTVEKLSSETRALIESEIKSLLDVCPFDSSFLLVHSKHINVCIAH